VRFLHLHNFIFDKFVTIMEFDIDLDTFRIEALPKGAFYISNFITEDEEDWLVKKVCCRLSLWNLHLV
jgi:hypothetical protein